MKLADIKKAADQKYSPYQVELEDGRIVEMRIPLRLSKEERASISRAFDLDDESNERKDMLDIYQEVFRILIEDDKLADALIAGLDEDLAFHQELFNDFSEQMQLGEANSSKN